jgi:hypothetical protein
VPTSFSDFEILAGTPAAAAASAPLLDVGGPGVDRLALQTLTHPLSAAFPPIVFLPNPFSVSNFMDEVIPTPLASTKRTLGTTLVVRHEGKLDDTDCHLVWPGTPGSAASMPSYLLREFINYLVNPPALEPAAQTYIVWAPRDLSLATYNVEFYKLQVGSGGQGRLLDFSETRGPVDPISNGFNGWDVDPTGFIEEKVTLTLHIVSEVS